MHLMSLCAGRERGLSGRQRRARIATWVGRISATSCSVHYPITVADVTAAESELPSMIERMAASTWSAWAVHHDTVRAWLDHR